MVLRVRAVLGGVEDTGETKVSLLPKIGSIEIDCYSRSPKNPALQQFQQCSKSASAGSWRPILNSFGIVGVWDFWENDCTVVHSGILHSNCATVAEPDKEYVVSTVFSGVM